MSHPVRVRARARARVRVRVGVRVRVRVRVSDDVQLLVKHLELVQSPAALQRSESAGLAFGARDHRRLPLAVHDRGVGLARHKRHLGSPAAPIQQHGLRGNLGKFSLCTFYEFIC